MVYLPTKLGKQTYLRRWWLAIRPHSLGTAVAPVLVGGGVAARDGTARPWAVALAVLGVAFLLIGVNLANDYFDYRSGADPPLGVGNRPLQKGILTPRAYLVGSFVAFALGGLAGVILVLASPPAILIVGLAGALLGFFYTAPPLKLGYRGLGELVVFACLGPGAAFGAYAVTAGRFSPTAAWAAIPIGLTVTGLLQANNLRDLADDARTGKRTLAVRLGEPLARREYAVLVLGAEAAAVVLAIVITPFAALGLLTAPQALRLAREAMEEPIDGRALMRATSSLHVRLTALLALGFAASRFVP
jgi:1,4-dihydroxy-2-naphthoate polyprenyltransferase